MKHTQEMLVSKSYSQSNRAISDNLEWIWKVISAPKKLSREIISKNVACIAH